MKPVETFSVTQQLPSYAIFTTELDQVRRSTNTAYLDAILS
jgi:hypothetical protein